jgi:hypothetical protein
MSNNEIRGLIEEVFDERIHSAIEKITKNRNEFDERKDLRTEEGTEKERYFLICGRQRKKVDFLRFQSEKPFSHKAKSPKALTSHYRREVDVFRY